MLASKQTNHVPDAEIGGASRDADQPTDQPTLYQQRQARGECVWGCTRQAADGSDYCSQCLPRKRASRAASAKATRAARRARGECAYCGRKSKLSRCRRCRAKGGGRVVGNATLAARTRPLGRLEWRTESDGKRRLRGVGRGHRGAPTVLETEGFDLRGMTGSLDRTIAEHAAFWSAENQALPKVQRFAPLVSALGQLELMMRMGEELADRWRKRLK